MDLCVSAKDTSSSLAAETWLQSQRSLNGLALNGSAPLNILSLNKRSLTREGFVMLLCCFAVIGAEELQLLLQVSLMALVSVHV